MVNKVLVLIFQDLFEEEVRFASFVYEFIW